MEPPLFPGQPSATLDTPFTSAVFARHWPAWCMPPLTSSTGFLPAIPTAAGLLEHHSSHLCSGSVGLVIVPPWHMRHSQRVAAAAVRTQQAPVVWWAQRR